MIHNVWLPNKPLWEKWYSKYDRIKRLCLILTMSHLILVWGRVRPQFPGSYRGRLRLRRIRGINRRGGGQTGLHRLTLNLAEAWGHLDTRIRSLKIEISWILSTTGVQNDNALLINKKFWRELNYIITPSENKIKMINRCDCIFELSKVWADLNFTFSIVKFLGCRTWM